MEEAARICRAKRWRTAFLEGLFFDQPVNFETSAHGHNKRPYRDPDAQPVKWMKLILTVSSFLSVIIILVFGAKLVQETNERI